MTKKRTPKLKPIDPRLEIVYRVIDDDRNNPNSDGAPLRQLLNATDLGCFDVDTVKMVFAILFASVEDEDDQSITFGPIVDAAESEHQKTCACCRTKARAA